MTRSGLLGPRPGPDEPLRIGFQVWGQYVSWDALMASGSRIEALGFSSLFANDHLMPVLGDGQGPVVGPSGPVFEAWLTVAGWAARTTDVALGVLVCGAGYRNVGLTVQLATTLDHASAGRAILGLGAGWHEPEHRSYGFGFPSLGERLSRLDEASAVARALLAGETVTAAGRWVSADRLRVEPGPVGERLPLLIGASGERRGLRIVARDADIWNGEGDPATFAHKMAILDAHCRAVGRDPRSIRRTAGIPPICIRDHRAGAVEALAGILVGHGRTEAETLAWAEASPLADSEANVARWLREIHRAGAEEVMVDWPAPSDDETLERLAGPVRERLG